MRNFSHVRLASCMWILIAWALSCGLLFGQTSASSSPSSPPPVTFTTDQDHQNMMEQLGIRELRPGRSPDEKAPNHANFDESQATPYPNLPDPLTL